MKHVIDVTIERECMTLITDITYKHENYWFGSTKKPMKMTMLLPKTFQEHKPLPLLLWLTGGSFMVSDKDVWIPQLIEFAAAGFIVASVQYRTSNEAHFPAALQDIKAAIRYLRAHAKEFCIDPSCVFIMGESAGGSLASLVGVTAGIAEYDVGEYLNISSEVQGVVDFYGVVDMRLDSDNIAELKPLSHGINPIIPYVNGDVSENNPLVEKASVYSYINAKTPPFMILHGTNDNIVNIRQSDMLYDSLVENGVKCEYYKIKNAGHGTDEFYQAPVIELVIKFLKSI